MSETSEAMISDYYRRQIIVHVGVPWITWERKAMET